MVQIDLNTCCASRGVLVACCITRHCVESEFESEFEFEFIFHVNGNLKFSLNLVRKSSEF